MTTIYLMRHSIPLKVDNTNNSDNLQIQNEKNILSLEGEKLAEMVSNNKIFDNIDVVYASNYTRAIGTAKYIAFKNDLKINVFDGLGERKFGIDSWDELPDEFEKKQFLDENYKLPNGENQMEVRERMYSSINKILKDNYGKRIVVVSHATALSYLLKKWCDIEIIDDKVIYSFNNNVILDNSFKYCEAFKLEFDDNNKLVNISNINI